MEKIDYDPRTDSELSALMREVLNNDSVRFRVIREDPILAMRLISILSIRRKSDAAKLGIKFVDWHRKSDEKGRHLAYLVARNINHEFAHEYLESRETDRYDPYMFRYTTDLDGYSEFMQLPSGHPVSKSDIEDAWDNLFKLCEETEI